LKKNSLKFSLFFTTAFFVFSEIWDILIYLLFPDPPTVITNLAANILQPNGTKEIVLAIISTLFFIFFSALLLAWLLQKLGAKLEFFKRQKWWLWFLAGMIFSLAEFHELLGRFGANLLVLVLLICLGFLYTKNKNSEQSEISVPNL